MDFLGALMFSYIYWVASARNLNSSIHPLSDRFIELTNQKAKTWTAGRNFPAGISMDDLKRRLGAWTDHEGNLTAGFVHDIPESFEEIDNFDAREEWPNCHSLNEIRNQGNCGSCWAISAAEVMTDRTCIHSEGKINNHYSTQDIVSCCIYCGKGCHGGYVSKAFEYWVSSGVVTGGPYNSSLGCWPYEISDDSPHGITPHCRNECREGYEIPFQKDKHFGRHIIRFRQQNRATKHEIMKNGPVVASFLVYDDFYNYKSGVYKHVEGSYSGKHAIKIIGFGVTEDNIKYWLCANSWGYDWGDKGYFKILRGSNECNIEYEIVTGTPFLRR